VNGLAAELSQDFSPEIAVEESEEDVFDLSEEPVEAPAAEETDLIDTDDSFAGYDLDAVTIDGAPDEDAAHDEAPSDELPAVELPEPDLLEAELPEPDLLEVAPPAHDHEQAYDYDSQDVGGNAPDQTPTDAETLGTVYCYVGGLTNLAIAVGRTCYFNRVLQNGLESMGATLAERRGLTLDHAREWLRHVGLEREVENIDGEREIIEEGRAVLQSGARRIADEVRLSIEYYQSTVPNAPRVENAVLAGPGIAIGGLGTLLEQELGLPVETRSMGRIEVRPGALDRVDGAQLTVATGLALDEVTT
jgi:hypothetical protein